jgi:hypothetical protein
MFASTLGSLKSFLTMTTDLPETGCAGQAFLMLLMTTAISSRRSSNLESQNDVNIENFSRITLRRP